jgi:hypothetical protein
MTLALEHVTCASHLRFITCTIIDNLVNSSLYLSDLEFQLCYHRMLLIYVLLNKLYTQENSSISIINCRGGCLFFIIYLTYLVRNVIKNSDNITSHPGDFRTVLFISVFLLFIFGKLAT